MKKVYLISKNGKGYTTCDKNEAIHCAQNNGANVYSLSYGYYKDCHFTMDIPTFTAVGQIIFSPKSLLRQ